MNRIYKVVRKMWREGNAALAVRGNSKFWLPLVWIEMGFFRIVYQVKLVEFNSSNIWGNKSVHKWFAAQKRKFKRTAFENKDNIVFVETINDQSKMHILRDKKILLQRMEDQLGREFIDLEECSETDFFAFAARHKKWIAKSRHGAQGDGIRVVEDALTDHELRRWYHTLLQNGSTIVEEFIVQHKDMDRLYPISVNSIRIHTLNINGDVQIVLYPAVELGCARSETSHGGIWVRIDSQTGCLFEKSIHGETKHPDTHAVFRGYPVPFFKEVKELAIGLARLVPEMTFVGWDIAICDRGPVVLEGNGAPASYGFYQQMLLADSYTGAKPDYEAMLLYAYFHTEMDHVRFAQIQDALFSYPQIQPNDSDIDAVIVQGSQKCRYRIEAAWHLIAGCKNKPVVVVSGGNFCGEKDGVGRTEAEYMREFLLGKGFPKENILLENRSSNTYENVNFEMKLLKRNHRRFSNHHPIKIAVVTAGFHMKHTMDILSKYAEGGHYTFIPVPAYGENTGPDNWYRNPKGVQIMIYEMKKLGYDILPGKWSGMSEVRNPFFLDSESGFDWTANPVLTGQ